MKRGRLDLDGVIANFSGMVCDVTGLDYPREKDQVCFYKYFGEKIDSNDFDDILSEKEFWSEMKPFSWAQDIINIFEKNFGDNWTFLTKGFVRSRDGKILGQDSFSGKVEWVNKHFPEHIDKLVVVSRDKHNLCSEDDFLLDDHYGNIFDWTIAGGYAHWWGEIPEGTRKQKVNRKLKELDEFIRKSKRP